jgi:hypothetical protein
VQIEEELESNRSTPESSVSVTDSEEESQEIRKKSSRKYRYKVQRTR